MVASQGGPELQLLIEDHLAVNLFNFFRTINSLSIYVDATVPNFQLRAKRHGNLSRMEHVLT